MIELPSMIVIDFLDWLCKHSFLANYNKPHARKNNITNKKPNIQVCSWILDSNNNTELHELAEKYLFDKNITYSIICNFVNSKDFKCFCEKNSAMVYGSVNYYDALDAFTSLFHNSAFVKVFRNYWRKNNLDQFINGVEPWILVDNLHDYIENIVDRYYTQPCMIDTSNDLSLDLDFLEWLKQNKHFNIDFCRIPSSVFEKLADDYCKDTKRSSSEKNNLIKLFKHLNTLEITEKCDWSERERNTMKDFGYIFDRYSNKTIPFHCFFLPLAGESDRFENFINRYWLDLHDLSGNHLDIFYSDEDFRKSGYAIKNEMRMIPIYLSNNLPSIVLWKDDLSKAQSIDIKGIEDDEIVRLIAKIVDLIIQNGTLDQIVAEANLMTDNIRQKHIDSQRPIENNLFNFGINYGVMAANIKKSKIINNPNINVEEQFGIETEQAISIINSFIDVEKDYRDTLISLLKDANEAIQNKNESAQNDCKNKFKGFLLGAGKVVGSIITKLSELATIASFFGL